jgi:tetratricopeptide (TPR) repeat protein
LGRLAGLLAFGLASGSALAQTAAEQQAGVNHMLDALRAAPDEATASMLEDKLEQTWLRAGTPAVTLLISRGLRSMHADQMDDALEAFTDAITLQPDSAEAWRQRAIVRYHTGDVKGAVHDLEETVRLQPRDFSAFRTLSEIAAARGDWKGAYAAWQKVLELDPKTQGGQERLLELKRKAVGEDT